MNSKTANIAIVILGAITGILFFTDYGKQILSPKPEVPTVTQTETPTDTNVAAEEAGVAEPDTTTTEADTPSYIGDEIRNSEEWNQLSDTEQTFVEDTFGLPDSLAESLIDDDPSIGNPDAPITIVEFSDYQCPFCKRFYDNTFRSLKSKYIDTGTVKFVFRDFPLQMHPQAATAANAANCAGEQNAYWGMHDLLFENQDYWANTADAAQKMADLAEQNLSLDGDQLKDCIDQNTFGQEIAHDLQEGLDNDVSGTPSFFINNQTLQGAQPLAAFEEAINNELNAAAQ